MAYGYILRLVKRLHVLRSWRPGRLAIGTFAMIVGMGLRTVGQAVVFLVVARVLGIHEYGAYSAVLALSMTLGGFVGFGSSVIMLRDTALDSTTFTENWGRTIAAIFISAPPVLLIYFLLAWVVLPRYIAWGAIVPLGIAEILVTPLTLAATQAYQGHDRVGRAAWLVLLPVLPRMSAAIILIPLTLWFSPRELLLIWVILYLTAAFAGLIYAMKLVRRDMGVHMRLHWCGLASTLRDGWAFAFGGAALKVYTDIDKTMLARLSTLEFTGAYSVAYRVTDFLLVPMYSLLAASVGRFFHMGEQGTTRAVSYAIRLLPLPLIYASILGVVVYELADYLPWILGSHYVIAVDVLRWLSWLPLFSLPRLILQQILVAANLQRILALILCGGAVLSVLMNLLAIPNWGWRGAVGVTYMMEVVMSVSISIILMHQSAR